MKEIEFILYDISKDAIAKCMFADEYEADQLFDAAIRILSFSTMVQNEDLLVMEDAVNDSTLEYFKKLALLVKDGIRPELLLEIAANGYWLMNPEGINAMVCYFYIRGMLLIQAGETIHLIETLLGSLIPEGWQDDYKKSITNMKQRTICSTNGSYVQSKKQKETTGDFSNIRPVFQDATLLEKLHLLETEILSLSDPAIQRFLRETDNFVLTICLYGFQEETREKIMDNVTERLRFMLQEDVAYLENIEETDVLKEVLHLTAIINRLRKSGEI